MKVLYIDINCKEGSTGGIVYDLFLECRKTGVESYICYGRGPLIKEKYIYKFGYDLETKFHALLTRLTGYTGYFSYFSTKKLINYINIINPDIIHIHELHAYFVNLKMLLKYLSLNNKKIVFTNHCDFLYTGKCGVAYSCKKYIYGCGKCPRVKEYPKSLIFDHSKSMWIKKKKLFDAFNPKKVFMTCPSSFLKNRLMKSFLNRFSNNVVVNPVDSQVFHFTLDNDIFHRYCIYTKKKIVLMVAANPMTSLKGGKLFIELAKKMVNTDFSFVLVGGNQELHDNNLYILKCISDKKILNKLYSNSYCTLVLSSYESFSMISVESQCSGTPVIYFDVGGIKETIVDNSGYGVSYGDLEQISHLLINNCFKNINRKLLSEHAINRFSKEKVYCDFFEIYKVLCD